MLMLAGLFGLMAVSGLMFLDDSTDESSDDVDQIDDMGGMRDDPDLAGAGPGLSPASGTSGENLILSGDTGDDTLSGSDGDDQVNGYDGDDTVSGGDGRDDLHGGSGDDRVSGGDGDDTLHGQDQNDILQGNDGNDTMFGHNDDDILSGGDGDDTLNGGDGNDVLRGGAGDDALHGGLGDDALRGGVGQDSLFGGWGNDTLTGVQPSTGDGAEDANDVDFLNGGGDNDSITIGAGDIATGGSGDDQFILGDWMDQDSSAEITDYDRTHDQLIMAWDLTDGSDPLVEVMADVDDDNLSHILVDGHEIASVHGNGQIAVDEILLVDHSGLAALGLRPS